MTCFRFYLNCNNLNLLPSYLLSSYLATAGRLTALNKSYSIVLYCIALLCISFHCIVLYCHPNICDIASKTKKFRFIPEIFGNLLKCIENDLQVRRTGEIIKGRESPIFLYLCLMHYYYYYFC